MNIGDLVMDEWGYIAIITSQVGVTDRWRIKYIRCGGVRDRDWETSHRERSY